MTWWHAVVESEHESQNPTSADKIRLLGRRLGLGSDSHVLDVASGRSGPALALAQELGCRVTCVERALELCIRDAFPPGGEELRSLPLPPQRELDANKRTDEENRLPLPETIERAESTVVHVVSHIASSEDDWDRYESLHWQTLDAWLAANPDHPQADEFHARGAADRDRYLRWERGAMGWAICVCRS